MNTKLNVDLLKSLGVYFFYIILRRSLSQKKKASMTIVDVLVNIIVKLYSIGQKTQKYTIYFYKNQYNVK